MHKPILIVVDDELNMSEFVAFVGESLGFDTRICITGNSFQKEFSNALPDLVVMDIAIPDIDAIDLLRWLSEVGCDAPVILMSGYGDNILNWARELGISWGIPISDVLLKPIPMQDLENAIKKCMS